MRVAAKVLGVFLSALGLGVSLFALLALADPQGAQLANDADPFGAPPATTETLLHLAVGLVALGAGCWLIFPRKAQLTRPSPGLNELLGDGQELEPGLPGKAKAARSVAATPALTSTARTTRAQALVLAPSSSSAVTISATWASGQQSSLRAQWAARTTTSTRHFFCNASLVTSTSSLPASVRSFPAQLIRLDFCGSGPNNSFKPNPLRGSA